MIGKRRGGGVIPSFFSESWRPGDGIRLQHQGGVGFDLSLVLGISRRCPWGAPQVVACRPLDKGTPFPTTWWLVCPYLREQCAREEERGGVRSLEGFLQDRKKAWATFCRRHALWRLAQIVPGTRRFLSLRRPGLWYVLGHTGMGGIAPGDQPRVKCLHLQVASWLVWQDHPGGLWLESHISLEGCVAPGKCDAEGRLWKEFEK